MITTIAEYKLMLEAMKLVESSDWPFVDAFRKRIAEFGLTFDEAECKLKDDNGDVAELEFYDDSGWLCISRIYMKPELQRRGLGFKIYESLYLAAKESNMKGLGSESFDEMGTQRTPAATATLNKLIKNMEARYWTSAIM